MYKDYTVDRETYFNHINKLILLLNNDIKNFDCIFAIKRSGLILGAILSNHFDLPLLTSDVKELPDKFKNILIVDDKICTGKTIQKYANRFYQKNKKFKVACLYIEGEVKMHYYVEDLNNKTHKMWYETKF